MHDPLLPEYLGLFLELLCDLIKVELRPGVGEVGLAQLPQGKQGPGHPGGTSLEKSFKSTDS